ncbi:MAG TPA: PIG-L deacetylase family protein [Blastocatellia bacterium]|nr:PIG-L deacetylase family protein [Blastocatellia bacterium]
MSEQASLLAVFAHPDDESLVAGGALAKYARAGVRTALVSATRGEWGPISDEALADYETLGEVREAELRAACEVLGVRWLRFLDLPDGGVSWAIEEGSEPLGKVVRAIRELRPQVVITFGPDGLYGHEDHIAVGRLTTEACSISHCDDVFPEHFREGLLPHHPDNLFYGVFPQGLVNEMAERLARSGMPSDLWGIPPERFGVPPETITHVIDVTDCARDKLAALRCHRTQLSADHAFAEITPELFARYLGSEYFSLHGAARPHNVNGNDLFRDRNSPSTES